MHESRERSVAYRSNARMPTSTARSVPRRCGRILQTSLLLVVAILLLAGCGDAGGRVTRTPVPTWTPTVGAPPDPAQAQQQAQAAQPDVVDPAQAAVVVPPVEAAPLQPIDTATPVPTVPPTVPPTPLPTEAPTETPTPLPTVPPTATPTPVPTATPNYAFALEAAEKFPTQALAPNVVRIWMYVYSPAALGLGGYSLRVAHNGAQLLIEEVSAEGLPGATFDTPGPFTRFANFDVLLVEAQAGTWDVQLVDATGAPAGPAAQFNLSADEETRELYVRYKQTGALP